MKSLGVFAFIFVVIILILMLTGGAIVGIIRKTRDNVRKAAERQEQQYKEEICRQRQQYAQRPQPHHARHSQEDLAPEAKAYQTDGATIIDNRHQEHENKKIFDGSDGEYVAFTEEK